MHTGAEVGLWDHCGTQRGGDAYEKSLASLCGDRSRRQWIRLLDTLADLLNRNFVRDEPKRLVANRCPPSISARTELTEATRNPSRTSNPLDMILSELLQVIILRRLFD